MPMRRLDGLAPAQKITQYAGHTMTQFARSIIRSEENADAE